MPFLKVPIHTSYVLFLSMFSFGLAMLYFRLAITLLKLTATQPSILLHPLDFIGNDDTTDLSFFPAMRIESKKKIRVMNAVFQLLKKNFLSVRLSGRLRWNRGELPMIWFSRTVMIMN